MPKQDKISWVRFSAGDWLGGTGSLSLAERGLYITACALIYQAGGAISKTDLKRLCPCRGDTFNTLLLRLIELGKLTISNGLVDQARCEIELEKARTRFTDRQRIGNGSADPSPHVSQEINEVHGPYARAKGESREEEDLDKNLKGGVGRCAPSGADGNVEVLSDEERAEVISMLDRTAATLKGEVPKGIRDAAAYRAAVKSNKFRALVVSLNAWVGGGLDGSARLAAWEVAAAASEAGQRSKMGTQARRDFDRLVQMMRASNAAEAV